MLRLTFRFSASRLVEAGRTLSQNAKQDLDAVTAQADAVRSLLKDYSDTLGSKTQDAAEDISAALATADLINRAIPPPAVPPTPRSAT